MAPPTEIRLTPSSASSPTVGRAREHQHADRQVDRGEQLAQLARIDDPRGEEDVGPGLLVGLQAGDGVAQVLPAVQVVLGAGRQDEGHGAAVGGFRGRPHPLGRVGQLVDRGRRGRP